MLENKWILVAGTGDYELPREVLLMSKSLGAKLARDGFGLVVGGWSGVDYVVAEAFGNEVGRIGTALRERLIQVVPYANDLPRYRGGHVVYVQPGTLEFTEAVKYCSAAVLLGGRGGTYGVYQVARQEQRPVLPLPCTGGDALQAYHEMLSDWPVPLPRSIAEQEFRQLDRHVLSTGEADRLADIVADLLATSLSNKPEQTSQQSVFISYSHKDKQWLEQLIDKLRPLQQRGELKIWVDPEIVPGDSWLASIESAITAANVAVLLVSSNSLRSSFIADKELQWLTGRAKDGQLRLLWFVVDRCDYGRFNLDSVQAAYDPTRPLSEMTPPEVNEALVAICKEIRRAVRARRA